MEVLWILEKEKIRWSSKLGMKSMQMIYSVNHTGSAGKMEVDGVIEMFQWSQDQFGVKYSHYIREGDTNTFKSLLESELYGEDFIVTKLECVNHVQKRLLNRIKVAKKMHSNQDAQKNNGRNTYERRKTPLQSTDKKIIEEIPKKKKLVQMKKTKKK